jgi:predicted GTPase
MSQANVVHLKPKAEETPAVVNQLATLGVVDYLRKLYELGALEGTLGAQSVSEELMPIIEAMHHVLAGGSVELKVTKSGSAKIVADLNDRFGQAMLESNEINRDAKCRSVPLWL